MGTAAAPSWSYPAGPTPRLAVDTPPLPRFITHMVRVLHVVFLAMLPLAIALALAGKWLWAGAVFVVGVPLFWSLRNAAASKQVGALMSDLPENDEYLPQDHPMVEAWAEPGERFRPPLGVCDWVQYLKTIDEPDRQRAVQASMRQLVLTDRRVMVVWMDQPLKGDIWLRDVLSVRSLPPPGKPFAGAEMAVEIKSRRDGGTLTAMWSMRREQADWLQEQLEEHLSRPGAIPTVSEKRTPSAPEDRPAHTVPLFSADDRLDGRARLSDGGLKFQEVLLPWSDIERVHGHRSDPQSLVLRLRTGTAFSALAIVVDAGDDRDAWGDYLSARGVSTST